MKIIYKKVQDLIPYINNSRTHSEEQVNQIVASINKLIDVTKRSKNYGK